MLLNRKSISIHWLMQGAVIAAMYVALTLLFEPISFGTIQIRIAEILTILPLFTSAAIPGLFMGCLLANLIGGTVVLDVVFGSIATLIGAALGYALRSNRWLVPLPAVLTNTVIVPFVLKYGYGLELPMMVIAGHVAVGEFVSCFILGELLASALLERKDIFE
ncbi:MAG: QueT transporter family protein [Eubacteriaceae bacterium]|nr:QueT transporter family protein [Eubacteriaceae bacterium]